jgi:hypothetical protein
VQSDTGAKWKNKGKQKTSHLSVNGVLEVERRVYWNKQRGTLVPMDAWLGILQHRYSAGVREMACRLSLSDAFMPASQTLLRTSQLSIGRSALWDLVQREGRRADQAMSGGRYGPDWTAADCTAQTVITGTDGVMVASQQSPIGHCHGQEAQDGPRAKEARMLTPFGFCSGLQTWGGVINVYGTGFDYPYGPITDGF